MGKSRIFLPALVVSALGLAVPYALSRRDLALYDGYTLPGFDGYVYMAMAQAPGFFTVSPWGYRLLVPWIVHLLPFGEPLAFRLVTLGGLALGGALVACFLARLGHSQRLCLLAALVFSLSGPVRQSVRSPYLTEPIAVCLEVGLLLALECGASAGTLAVLLALGVLAKEMLLFFLPVVYLARRGRDGKPLLSMVLVALPSLALTTLLHRFWAPESLAVGPEFGSDAFWVAVYRILEHWREWIGPCLLQGLTLLALVGGLRRGAGPFLARYGFVLVPSVAIALGATLLSFDAGMVQFFALDVERLLLYTLPVVLPLAARAFGSEGALAPAPAGAGGGRLAWLAAVALVCLPVATQDRYRRMDLHAVHDGKVVLAFCRGTLAFAERLAQGRPVVYEVEARSFVPRKTDPHLLDRMRWFLWTGWGPKAPYSAGPVVMAETVSTVVLPCSRPADWEVVLTLAGGSRPFPLRLSLNGQTVGELTVSGEKERYPLRLASANLVRGDNLLELRSLGLPQDRARLHDLKIQPLS